MIHSERVEIKLSKVKLFIMLLGCLLFVTAGILFIINPKNYESFLIRSPTFILISGWTSVLFFGFIGFFILKKIGNKLPGLVISEEGITDNSSGLSAGFIPWSDIIAIKETKVVNQKFINIVVKDSQLYIDRQKNGLKRRAMQTNYNMWGTAIGISVNGLNSNYDNLKKILEKSFSDFKSKSSK